LLLQETNERQNFFSSISNLPLFHEKEKETEKKNPEQNTSSLNDARRGQEIVI